MRWSILVPLVVVILSCTNTERETEILPQDIVFTETFDIDSLIIDDDPMDKLKFGISPVYIGPIANKITLDYTTNYNIQEEVAYDWRSVITSDDLEIYIDTTRVIANKVLNLPPPPPPAADEKWFRENKVPDDWPRSKRGKVKSYPVFFTNKSKRTIAIGDGGDIEYTVEAIDSSGIYKPISHVYPTLCGTGLFSQFLNKNEMAIAPLTLTSGAYKTKIRILADTMLTHKHIYSNAIDAMIDPNWFDIPEDYDTRW